MGRGNGESGRIEVRDPELLEAVLESYPFGGAVAIYDADHRYLMVRGQGWRDLGTDPRDLTGKRFDELWPEEVATSLGEMADLSFTGMSVVRRLEYEGRVWEMVATPVDRGDEHDPEGVFFSRDITEETGWEALQGHLLASVPTAVAAVDLSGRVIYWNAQAERLLGFAAEEVLGRSRYDIEARVLRPEAGAILAALGEGDEWEAELPVVDRDGRERSILFKSTPVHDRRGQKVGVMGVGEDLTEHRALEDRIQRLERLDSIGRLAAGVAHDFANVLSVVSGGLGLLEGRIRPEDEPILRDMRDGVRQASELTRKLLAVGRSDPAAPGVSDIAEVLRGEVDLLRRWVTEGVELEVEIDVEGVSVGLDEGRLQQVLHNLVTNAAQAIAGEGRIGIALGRLEDGRVSVRVSDDGAGIPDEVIDQIFEPFVTSRGAEGTGLGLATVWGLVNQVGGEVEVLCTGPDGTTFEVRLPPA
jgi:PAS domain S-box-containing protein